MNISIRIGPEGGRTFRERKNIGIHYEEFLLAKYGKGC